MAYLSRAAGRGRRGGGQRGRWRRAARAGTVAALGLLAVACAGAPPAPPAAGPVVPFDLARDVFGFANLVRAERPGWNDDFANFCIIMVRAANQFYRFARFAPDLPPVSEAEYRERVRLVYARGAWEPPLAEADRVVFPGYADLRAFSRAHEATVKASFGSNILSMMHWRTWRITRDYSPEHQAGLARDLVAEIDAGRPAALMITNFPHEDLLNHVVLVYGHRPSGAGIEFLAYDPNDPGSPLGLHFDAATRRFWVPPLTYSPPGPIRAFRLYASPLF